MQYWVINEKNELITTSNVPCSIEWMQSVEVPDDVTCGYVLTDKWEWIKWENLVKQEEIEKFKAISKKIIELEQKELVKWYLTSELENTKNSLNSTKEETVIDEKQEAIIELNNKYEELIKKYWEDIKNELF